MPTPYKPGENRLTILSTYRVQDYNSPGRTIPMARCKCACGERFNARLRSIQQGFTRSCGCLRVERITELNKNTNPRRAA